MTPVRRSAAATLLPGFVGTTLPDWLEKRLRDGLAGVCIFGGNIVSREQLRRLTDQIREANPHALIAIDEEGGDVTRLYYDSGSPYPGNAVLGRIDDPEYTESVARAVGWELRRTGCNLDFAPDIDINSNPNNPVIGVRSFGSDPDLVAKHTAAWTRGLQSTGVAASAKHFPGHGDTGQDSHMALPVLDLPVDVLRARELVPFIAAIEAETASIMTSHIVLSQLDPDAPATFSSLVLQDLLRGELGFDGVIVSDALDMKGASGIIGMPAAAVRALAAGCDLLCIGTDNTDAEVGEIEDAIVEAVTTGALDVDTLENAAARTLGLGEELAEHGSVSVPEKVGGEPQFDLNRTIASFDVQPGVRVEAHREFLGIATVANIAIGISPWGPASAGAEVQWLFEGEDFVVPDSGQLVIVGKDNHRYPWVRRIIEGLRVQRPSTVVVDLGWPADDRMYADVATFGASRHVSQALLAWLEREQL